MRDLWLAAIPYPVYAAALLWRMMLIRTGIVAITGSFGKTSSKDCLAAILGRSGTTMKTPENRNGMWGCSTTILRTRPWHRYAVVETGTDRPGGLRRLSFLLRPDVVVELRVDRAHSQGFRNLDNTAMEKAQLLRFMDKRGVAVLNGDDDRVAAMAGKPAGRVVLFGTAASHDVRATNVRSQWPDRLRFTVHAGGANAEVRTNLVGEHWMYSVLGAIAAAWACGVPIEEAAEAVAEVEPFTARMDPRRLPNGAVILRDEYNGSIGSFDAALAALREARVERRVLVIGDCADFRKTPRQRVKYYASVARGAADRVVFVGERHAYGVQRAMREGFDPEDAVGFFGIEEATEWLREELRDGDLALVRGTHAQHFERIYFGLLGTVQCTRSSCRLRRPCDGCSLLGFAPGNGLAGANTLGGDSLRSVTDL